MISIKVHRKGEERVLAACDRELLGKEFEEDEIKLATPEDFYFERIVSKEELQEELEKATIANLVGEKAVDAFVETSGDCRILRVEGVPHVQVFTI